MLVLIFVSLLAECKSVLKSPSVLIPSLVRIRLGGPYAEMLSAGDSSSV